MRLSQRWRARHIIPCILMILRFLIGLVFEKVDGAGPLRVEKTAHLIKLVMIIAEMPGANCSLICLSVWLTATFFNAVLDSWRGICLFERADYLAELVVRHWNLSGLFISRILLHISFVEGIFLLFYGGWCALIIISMSFNFRAHFTNHCNRASWLRLLWHILVWTLRCKCGFLFFARTIFSVNMLKFRWIQICLEVLVSTRCVIVICPVFAEGIGRDVQLTGRLLVAVPPATLTGDVLKSEFFHIHIINLVV